MRAILSVHHEQYRDSRTHIEQTRRQLDTIMTSLLTESYSRAYVPFIMVQQCSELEEIIEYKMLLRESLIDHSGENANNILTEGNNGGNNNNNNTDIADCNRSPVNVHVLPTSGNNDRFSPVPRSPSPVPPGNNNNSSGSGSTTSNPTIKAEILQRKAFLT